MTHTTEMGKLEVVFGFGLVIKYSSAGNTRFATGFHIGCMDFMIHPGPRKSYISWWSSSQPSWSMCALVPTCLNTHGFRPPPKKKTEKMQEVHSWGVKISWINTFRRGQNWPPKIFHPRGEQHLERKDSNRILHFLDEGQ